MEESLGKNRLTIEDVQTACEMLFGSDAGEAVSLLDSVDEHSLEEKIGESALRMRYLTPFRRNAVLGLQRMIQRPIGVFFLENDILSPIEMVRFLELVKNHNSSVA
ncbi:MAG: hypothetical protein ACC669_09580 [bacterium]